MKLMMKLENLFAAAAMAEEGDSETAARIANEGETRCACGGPDADDGRDCLSSPARA